MKYDLSGLMPLFLYPVALIALGNLPPSQLLGKLLAASPFALLVGVFNPFLDRTVLIQIGSVHISGGWISYASILRRFTLTVSEALILVSTTGFNSVCRALACMKAPKSLTLQFMLLYRYIFVLAEEASRMFKAWSLRSVMRKRMPLKVFVSLMGQLLIRALDRAQRVHMAMLSRGFDGEIHLSGRCFPGKHLSAGGGPAGLLRPLTFGALDFFFIVG